MEQELSYCLYSVAVLGQVNFKALYNINEIIYSSPYIAQACH